METKLAFKSQEGKIAVLACYDALLEQWSMPHEQLYVNTRCGRTFVLACGEESAPPLILLHGSGMNSFMWLEDAREYARHHRVYAVDIPGEPGKSDERQLPLKGADYADWLDDVYHALSVEQAGLIGISLGAWLALKFAVGYPHKVNKLVLLSPLGISPQKNSFLFTAMFYMMQGEKGTDKFYRKINGSQPFPAEMLKYQRLIGKSFNSRRELIPLFSDDELKRLTMPVALFVGEEDIIIHAARTAKRLKSLLPHADVHVQPKSGHTLVNLAGKVTAAWQH